MANIVEFILQLKDMMSSGMQRAAATAQSSLNRVTQTANRANTSINGIGGAAQTAATRGQRSVAVLERALRMLENRRRLMVDDSALAASHRRARALRAEIERLRNLGAPGADGGGAPLAGGGANIAGLVKKGVVLGLAVKGAQMIGSGANAAYGASLQNMGVEKAINVTTRGQGNEAIAQTKAITDKYGINYDAAAQGVKTLTGGLMGMNMPLREQMKIFEGVSTGVAALGVDAEAAKGAFLALGQMASKGTVSAEELRGQLGERIPGAFSIAARAMGVTEAALGKMMEKGEIAASDFLPRFAAEMQKTFGEAALANANGPQAIQNRFDNAMSNMQKTVGEGLMPIITPMLVMLTDLASTTLPVITELFAGIANVLPAIKSGVSEILAPITSIQINTQSWGAFLNNIKPTFNIIKDAAKSILSTVISVVGGIVEWLANSQILKDVFSLIGGVAASILSAVEFIADKLKWVFDNVIRPILEGIDVAYRFLTGAQSKREELAAQQAAKDAKSANENLAKEYASRDSYYSERDDRQVGIPRKSTALAVAGSGSGKAKSGSLGSKGVTHSGPKVITINFNKEFIGDMNINSYNIKEGVGEMEDRIKEAVYRIFYSLETENG